jgi:hypothetical protein
MNVGPGNNFQGGPFPQGGPFGGPQGNVGPGGFGGMNFPMGMQGNMMQPGNMMGNMDPRMMMSGNMQGNFNMNPMHGMQNYPNMMMGPNAGKMPGGGFGGPMGMQGQFGDQGGRPGQQPQTQQKVMDLRNEIMGMIHKTNVPMGGGPNQDMNMGNMQREGQEEMGMHGHMGHPGMMQQHQGMPQGPGQGQNQGHGQDQSPQEVQQGGAATGVNSLSQQEKKLLKEIMENKNKRDPRCAQRIKEILIKHPRIKEFIMNQNKAQQQQQQ